MHFLRYLFEIVTWFNTLFISVTSSYLQECCLYFDIICSVHLYLIVVVGILPDALETDCSKCSETQRKAAKKVIQHLVNNKADMWEELMVMYDPDGEFKKKYEGEWLNED